MKKENVLLLKSILEKRTKQMDETEKMVLVPLIKKGFSKTDKTEKKILKRTVEKELEEIKGTEKEIEFPSGNFIKSREIYEEKLNEMLKEIKQ